MSTPNNPQPSTPEQGNQNWYLENGTNPPAANPSDAQPTAQPQSQPSAGGWQPAPSQTPQTDLSWTPQQPAQQWNQAPQQSAPGNQWEAASQSSAPQTPWNQAPQQAQQGWTASSQSSAPQPGQSQWNAAPTQPANLQWGGAQQSQQAPAWAGGGAAPGQQWGGAPGAAPAPALSAASIMGNPAKRWAAVSIITSLLVFIGSLGTWASVSAFGYSQSVAGTHGDGKGTLVLALVGIAAAVWFVVQGKLTWLPWVVAGTGLISAIIGFIDWADLGNKASNTPIDVSVSWGLVLVCVFGLATLALGILAGLMARKSTTPAQRPYPPMTGQYPQQPMH